MSEQFMEIFFPIIGMIIILAGVFGLVGLVVLLWRYIFRGPKH